MEEVEHGIPVPLGIKSVEWYWQGDQQVLADGTRKNCAFSNSYISIATQQYEVSKLNLCGSVPVVVVPNICLEAIISTDSTACAITSSSSGNLSQCHTDRRFHDDWSILHYMMDQGK